MRPGSYDVDARLCAQFGAYVGICPMGAMVTDGFRPSLQAKRPDLGSCGRFCPCRETERAALAEACSLTRPERPPRGLLGSPNSAPVTSARVRQPAASTGRAGEFREISCQELLASGRERVAYKKEGYFACRKRPPSGLKYRLLGRSVCTRRWMGQSTLLAMILALSGRPTRVIPQRSASCLGRLSKRGRMAAMSGESWQAS